MWELSKEHDIKPWEYQSAYDERGNPILYQEDILVFRYLDTLEAKYQWRASQGANKGGSISPNLEDSPFKTTKPGLAMVDQQRLEQEKEKQKDGGQV